MSGGAAPRELVLLPSLKALRGPRGGLVLTRKYLDGAAEYARGWPGPVTSLVELAARPGTDMDPLEVLPGEAATGLELRPRDEAALAARLGSAALAFAFLAPWEEPLARLCRRLGVPVVFGTEYSPRTERQILAAEVANPLRRLRRRLWLRQAERARLRMLPLAAGLQCSGTPSFEHYGPRVARPLLFFDNRVRQAEVIGAAALEARLAALLAGAPLRLVFGGRLVAMKGVLDLVPAAAALARLGVPFTLDIFGAGPLEGALRARIAAAGLGGRVRLGGVLDFRGGWIPHLAGAADLFLCCHPQGDPSSTYPEVMSCGVPIAGYDNEAFAGIERHSGAGWLAPVGDAARLAAVVAGLHAERGAIAAAARRARAFALGHVFEATFARRTAHLVAASRLPGVAAAAGTAAAGAAGAAAP